MILKNKGQLIKDNEDMFDKRSLRGFLDVPNACSLLKFPKFYLLDGI